MALSSLASSSKLANSLGLVTGALVNYEEMVGGSAFVGQTGADAAANITQKCHAMLKILETAVISDEAPMPHEISMAISGIADLLTLGKIFAANE